MARTLIHLSTDPNLKLMTPRIPNNRLTYTGYENATIPRICFAPSINSALAAAPPVKTGVVLYVYTPTSIDPKAVYKPSTKEVPDSSHTHEIWYLKPCTVKKIGAIIVGDIIRAKYWEPKERKGHYDLEWYTYKHLRDPMDKQEIDRYLKKQPMYMQKQRELQQQQSDIKSARLKGIIGGALAATGGIAIFNLIGNKLSRIK